MHNFLTNSGALGMTYGLLQALVRRDRSSEEFKRVADLGTRFFLCSFGLLAIFSIILARPVSVLLFSSPDYSGAVRAVAFAVFASGIGMASDHIMIAVGLTTRYTVTRSANYLLAAGGTVIGTFVGGVSGAIWGWSLGFIVAIAVTWAATYQSIGVPRLWRALRFWETQDWQTDRTFYGEMAPVGVTTTLVSFITIGGQMALRTAMIHRLGESELGLYQALVMLTTALSPLVSNAIWARYYPVAGAEADPARLDQATRWTLLYCILVMTPLNFAVLIGAKVIVPLALSQKFAPILPWLAWQLAAELLTRVFGMYHQLLLARNRFRAYLLLGAVQAVTFLVPGLLLLSSAGVMGVVAAGVFSGACSVALGAWFARDVGVRLRPREAMALAGSLATLALPALIGSQFF